MKRVMFLSLFVLSVGLWSCGSKVDNEALKNQVLDTHDEVMPRIGELITLRKKILNKVADMEGNEGGINDLRDIAKDLNDAHDGMMNWMREWSTNSDPYINGKATEEEITRFYKEEQEKVDKVKADILNSLAAAKAALK